MIKTTKIQHHKYIHLIIFLSGFTFLIYEVVWNRMLSLLLGATVSASTIVLVSFMAGFGLGAFFWGKYAGTSKKMGQLLSFLLFSLGVLSLLNYILIKYPIPMLYGYFSGKGLSVTGIEIIVFTLVSLLLMVSTFFMGGVLPVVSKIVIQSKAQISTGLGKIYAIETLGSALGGLVTGFILLGSIGQKNTIFLAVILNLVLALTLLLSKKFNSGFEKEVTETAIDSSQKSKRKKNHTEISNDKKAALLSTFIFGFSILGLQATWIRIFKIYLTNTSYTFALISSLVILGLFVGSWLFKKYSGQIKNYIYTMLKALIALSVILGIGLLLLVKMPEFIMFPFRDLLGNPFVKLLIMPMIAALLIVFPAAGVSGYAFPLACRMFSSESREISHSVGLVLTVNTIGGVAGPILATFLFIPFIGVGVSILLFMLLIMLVGIFLSFQLDANRNIKPFKYILFAASLVLLITVIIKPQIRILPPSFSQAEKEIMFYKETVEASLVVGKEKSAGSEVKTTYVNNAVVIGSTYDAIKAVKMIGHLPFFAGVDCGDVLVVGFGMGVTAATIASHPEVKTIDCVELASGLTEAAKFYKDINNDVIHDPRLSLIPGDGRHFLQRTKKKYDLISSDPTHPILGSANLYSHEYFELCKIHLKPGGMVSQYLPLHKLTPENFQGIIKTFYASFPNTTVWLGHTHAIFIGRGEPAQIDFKEWKKNISEIERDPVFYSDPYHLAAGLMLDGEIIKNFSSEIKINTDNLSYLEFFTPSCFDEDNLNKNITFLSENRVEVNEVFSSIDDPQKMERFIRGNQNFIKSAISFQNGEKQKSLDELHEAVKVNPENQEYPFLIKFYYNVDR
jgi:spermidine synthase